ncbi:MAG: hypothetical protein QXI36_00925 [Candidatus Bathyarchaeia archaeon]
METTTINMYIKPRDAVELMADRVYCGYVFENSQGLSSLLRSLMKLWEIVSFLK